MIKMTPEERAGEWTNVDQVMERVRQEGDANCERAFDFLLRVRAFDIAQERAACAEIADAEVSAEVYPRSPVDCSQRIAAAIRARGLHE